MLRRRLRLFVVAVLAAPLALTLPVITPQASAVVPTSNPVTADSLPTVQINGIVWKQVIAGNTVFAGGQFTAARPAGAAAGVNTVPRTNMLAYNITTGVMDPNFAPNFNGQINDMAVTPDGTKLIVVGAFTQVNGLTRNRAAVFNLPSMTLSTTVVPNINGMANSVAATNSVIYFGGYFSGINGTSRPRLGAVSASNGSVRPFAAAVADNQVQSIVVDPTGAKVLISGNFTSVNGSNTPGFGLAMLDGAVGTSLPLPLNNSEVRNAGPSAGFLRLASDGEHFYGVGWAYGGTYTTEGTFKARWSDGELVWLEDCHGDTYDVAPTSDAVYTASHKHYCGNGGDLPQSSPWTYYRATAFSQSVEGVNTPDIHGYPSHSGVARPGVMPWLPTILAGNFTGKGQGPWAVTANSDYVLYGGEFPNVNGVTQQGIARFAKRSLATNKQGPRTLSGAAVAAPTVRSYEPGKLRISWPALWDRDDTKLTYQVFRDVNTNKVYEGTQTAFPWDGQDMAFTDSGLTPGSSVRYAIRVLDPSGNLLNSAWSANVTVGSTDSVGAYGSEVLGDGANKYWRLGETSGSAVADLAGTDNATAGTGVTRNQAGALLTSTDRASNFNGGSNAVVPSTQFLPVPDEFSHEVWFRTTSSGGGRLIGYGNRQTGTSSSYADRHLYMDNSGRLRFGVMTTAQQTVQSQSGLNNGLWHQAVTTMGSDGMKLYVDGKLVDSKPSVTTGRSYYGYLRVGGDRTWAGNSYFNGTIDEVSVYSAPLTAQQVDDHWVASGRPSTNPPPPVNLPPVGMFSSNVTNLKVDVDATASTDLDGNIASYSWNWGDSTAAGAGVTDTHTYANPGTYTVTLTVTDDDGATDTEEKNVTVTAPPNQAPTAAFTPTPTNLKLDVDGSASTDSDGNVASYEWTWGDNTALGSGAVASHTYANPGNYEVTLKVTDDDGATDTETQTVTVNAPPPVGVLASDNFSRTVANGWGTAPTGGAWTVRGGATNFSVNGDAGLIRIAAGTLFSDLLGVSSSNARTTAQFSVDKLIFPTYVHLVGRQTNATDSYYARVRIAGDGTAQLYLIRTVGSAQTSIGGASGFNLPFTLAPNDRFNIKIDVAGTSPTTVSAKAWKVGDAEPASWQKTATDTSATLQSAGRVGVAGYIPANNPDAPLTLAVWDFLTEALS